MRTRNLALISAVGLALAGLNAAAPGAAADTTGAGAGAAVCPGHYEDLFGQTYRGEDRTDQLKEVPQDNVLGKLFAAAVKKRVDSPLGLTLTFHRDQYGGPAVDASFIPLGSSTIKPMKGEALGYGLQTGPNPRRVTLHPKYRPTVSTGGGTLDPNSVGWNKAVKSQTSGYTTEFRKDYKLNALECTTLPDGKSVPERLSQTLRQNQYEKETVELVRVH